MWWCCGKRGREQPGCKFAKHECKEDDDDDNDRRGDGQGRNQKYVRCTCCKELGHTIEECTRDPNFRTNHEVAKDQQRINKIRDFRKLHADTVVNTTHFIKKSIMIPLAVDDEGHQCEPQNLNHPFMRGIMQFDDYNYKQYNSFVLIEEPKTE